MLARLGQVLYWATYGIAGMIALSSCASISDLPPTLREGAECISAKLKSMPGISDVGLSVDHNKDGPFPVVRYNFTDEAGQRRTVRFGIFETTMGPAYDLAIAGGFAVSVNGSHIAIGDMVMWQDQCGVGGFLRT